MTQFLLAIFGRYPLTFLEKLFTIDDQRSMVRPCFTPTEGVKSTSGFGALSRRTEVRLARRRGSAASRRVASRRYGMVASATRVTLAVSAACALSPRCAGPLLSRSFSLDFQRRAPSCFFHPFGITRLSFESAFKSYPRFPVTLLSLSHPHVHRLVPCAIHTRH